MLTEPPVQPTEPDPAPSDAGPSDETAPTPIASPAAVEPTPPPERSSAPKAAKPKPKTDQEVVAALKPKLIAKCKDAGATKVQIEGVISSTGTVGSVLITPPNGLGGCAKEVVSRAKFDPAAGTRPMPRFSVKL